MTFPPECPAATITLNLDGPHWTIPLKAVIVPAGGSGGATLEFYAANTAPLGPVSTNLRVKGFDGPYETMVPFQFEVKPFSEKVEAAENIEAKAMVLSEGPPGPRFPVSEIKDTGNGGYVQEFSTGNIYWHPQTGARWVYGAILVKYLGLGGPGGFLGYPLTDETGAADGIGRYNNFQAGSIYYTAATGAHGIRGRIRDHWAGLGSEKSYLGYPMLDQAGNTLRFQRGTIEIKPVEGVEQTRDEPDSRVIGPGTIHTPDDAACRGSAELTIFSTGRWHFRGSIAATGFPSYDVSLGVAIHFKAPQGRPIAILEDGDVEGWGVLGGEKFHVWDRTGHNPFIAANWDGLKSANWTATLRVEHGPGDVLAYLATWLGFPGSIAFLLLVGGEVGKNVKMCCRLGGTNPAGSPGSEVDRECIFWEPDRPCPPQYPLG